MKGQAARKAMKQGKGGGRMDHRQWKEQDAELLSEGKGAKAYFFKVKIKLGPEKD